MAPTFTIHLAYLQCVAQTGDVGDDEPYVVAAVCGPGIAASAVASDALESVQAGQTRHPTQSVNEAGFTLHRRNALLVLGSIQTGGAEDVVVPLPLVPDEVIILVALMEKDSGHPLVMQRAVASVLAGCTAAYALNSWTRRDRLLRLRLDMLGALQLADVAGVPNNDDFVGMVRELPVDRGLLDGLAPGQRRTIALSFDSQEDAGRYGCHFVVERFT